ncbi:uncharacterized protein LOC128237216 isoform X2 [Mya arenaria]|uniref:uncharacterized protein LOC128237216 isoform X2 n=1 Tax=Mya arenaria TaxID=6604 RepID=UPI0022E5580B|nr:uncharacterized protein LOC128237216 isoform X2 [Mya arenaria]
MDRYRPNPRGGRRRPTSQPARRERSRPVYSAEDEPYRHKTEHSRYGEQRSYQYDNKNVNQRRSSQPVGSQPAKRKTYSQPAYNSTAVPVQPKNVDLNKASYCRGKPLLPTPPEVKRHETLVNKGQFSGHETLVKKGQFGGHETLVKKGQFSGHETLVKKGHFSGHETLVKKGHFSGHETLVNKGQFRGSLYPQDGTDYTDYHDKGDYSETTSWAGTSQQFANYDGYNEQADEQTWYPEADNTDVYVSEQQEVQEPMYPDVIDEGTYPDEGVEYDQIADDMDVDNAEEEDQNIIQYEDYSSAGYGDVASDNNYVGYGDDYGYPDEENDNYIVGYGVDQGKYIKDTSGYGDKDYTEYDPAATSISSKHVGKHFQGKRNNERESIGNKSEQLRSQKPGTRHTNHTPSHYDRLAQQTESLKESHLQTSQSKTPQSYLPACSSTSAKAPAHLSRNRNVSGHSQNAHLPILTPKGRKMPLLPNPVEKMHVLSDQSPDSYDLSIPEQHTERQPSRKKHPLLPTPEETLSHCQSSNSMSNDEEPPFDNVSVIYSHSTPGSDVVSGRHVASDCIEYPPVQRSASFNRTPTEGLEVPYTSTVEGKYAHKSQPKKHYNDLLDTGHGFSDRQPYVRETDRVKSVKGNKSNTKLYQAKRIKNEIFDYSHEHKPDFLERRPSKVTYHSEKSTAFEPNIVQGEPRHRTGSLECPVMTQALVPETFEYDHSPQKSSRYIDAEAIYKKKDEKSSSVQNARDSAVEREQKQTRNRHETGPNLRNSDDLVQKSRNVDKNTMKANIELTATLLEMQKTLSKIGEVIQKTKTVSKLQQKQNTATTSSITKPSETSSVANTSPVESTEVTGTGTPVTSKTGVIDLTEAVVNITKAEIERIKTMNLSAEAAKNDASEMDIDDEDDDMDVQIGSVELLKEEDNETVDNEIVDDGDTETIQKSPLSESMSKPSPNENVQKGKETSKNKDCEDEKEKEQKDVSESEEPEKKKESWKRKTEYKTYREWRQAKLAMEEASAEVAAISGTGKDQKKVTGNGNSFKQQNENNRQKYENRGRTLGDRGPRDYRGSDRRDDKRNDRRSCTDMGERGRQDDRRRQDDRHHRNERDSYMGNWDRCDRRDKFDDHRRTDFRRDDRKVIDGKSPREDSLSNREEAKDGSKYTVSKRLIKPKPINPERHFSNFMNLWDTNGKPATDKQSWSEDQSKRASGSKLIIKQEVPRSSASIIGEQFVKSLKVKTNMKKKAEIEKGDERLPSHQCEDKKEDQYGKHMSTSEMKTVHTEHTSEVRSDDGFSDADVDHDSLSHSDLLEEMPHMENSATIANISGEDDCNSDSRDNLLHSVHETRPKDDEEKKDGLLKPSIVQDIAKNLVVKLVDIKRSQEFKDRFCKADATVGKENPHSFKTVDKTIDAKISNEGFSKEKSCDEKKKHSSQCQDKKDYYAENSDSSKKVSHTETTDKINKVSLTEDIHKNLIENYHSKERIKHEQSMDEKRSCEKNKMKSKERSVSQGSTSNGNKSDKPRLKVHEKKETGEDKYHYPSKVSSSSEKSKKPEEKMFSSDSDESQEDIFGKIEELLKRDRNKSLLKLPKNNALKNTKELTGMSSDLEEGFYKRVHKTEKDFVDKKQTPVKMDDILSLNDHVLESSSVTQSSDTDNDQVEKTKQVFKRIKNCVKGLRKDKDTTFWKSFELKFPLITLEKLSKRNIVYLQQKLQSELKKTDDKKKTLSLHTNLSSSSLFSSSEEVKTDSEKSVKDAVRISKQKELRVSSERNLFDKLSLQGLPETDITVAIASRTGRKLTVQKDSGDATENTSTTSANDDANTEKEKTVMVISESESESHEWESLKAKTKQTVQTQSKVEESSNNSSGDSCASENNETSVPDKDTENVLDFEESTCSEPSQISVSSSEVLKNNINIKMAQFKRVDSNATTRSETSVSTVDEAGYSEIDAFLESEAEPAPNESNAVNVSEPGEDDEAENIQMDLESALFEHFEEGSEDSMEDIDESNMLDEQHHLNQSLKKRKNKSETSDTSEDDEGIANAERDKRKNKYEKTIGSAKTEEKNDGDKVHSSSQERGKQSRRRPASSKAKKSKSLRTNSIFAIDLVESGGEGDVEDNISVFNLDPPSEDEELSPSQDLFADLIHGKHRDCQQVPNISHPVREENDEKNQNDLDLQGKSLCTLFNNETQGYISPSGGVDECVENRNAETSNPEQEQEKVKCKTGEDKEEAEVKDEPVWLKFGYTQEPDTIFLSDGDDDIIMSFSQPIIDLVSSDEENVQSNPEDSSKFGETQAFEVRVKAEDDDKDYPEPSQICHDDNDLLDMEYFDDDWSDKGSDFDPNDIFDTSRNVTRSLGMDGNDLYISSDEDIFQSQSNSDGIDVKTELQMAESETRKGISDDITNEMPLTETDKKQGEPESDETNDFASGDDEFLGITMQEFDEQQQDGTKDKYSVQTQPKYSTTEHTGTRGKSGQLVDNISKKTDDSTSKMNTNKESPSVYDAETQLHQDLYEPSINDLPAFDLQFEPISDDECKDHEGNKNEHTSKDSDMKVALDKVNDQKTNEHYIRLRLKQGAQKLKSLAKALRKEQTPPKEEDKINYIGNETKSQEISTNQDYEVPTQVIDDFELSDMEYSESDVHDPQLEAYMQPTQKSQDHKQRLFSRELGINVSSFEEEEKSDRSISLYDANTQISSFPSGSTQKPGSSHDVFDHMTQVDIDRRRPEKSSSIVRQVKVQDSSNYDALTQKQSLSTEFDVLTQRDPLKKTNDIFVASTQASPTNNVKMSKKNVYHTPTLMDDLVINLDEDSQESTQSEQSNHQDIRDYYQIATQAHEGKITDRHTADVPGNNPSRVTFHNNDDLTLIDEGDSDEASVDDVYLMETQVLDNRTAEDKNETDKYIVATQIDTNSRESTDSEKSIKNKDQYEVDTQLDDDFELDDLPDLVDSDPYMVATQIDRIDDEDGSLSVDSTGQGTKNRPSSALKRPRSDSIGNDKDQSAPKSGDSVLPFKKPKLALSVKKPVVIEPQKLKSVAEKRASGVVTKTPSVDHKTSTPSTSSNKHDNIMMIDANHGDMWLSKKIHTSRTDGKSSKPVKRKRHESAEDILKSKVAAAKSRQKERMMQTIINPATIADKVRQKPVTSVPEFVDDVELPTNSQIVNQGLPLLNPMGILPKKTPHAYSGPSHRGKTSSASVTTTTVSIATGSTSTSSRPQPTTVTATTSSTVSISAASSLKMSETGKAMDKHVLKKDQHQKRKHEDDNSKDEKRHGKDKHRGKSEEKGSYKQADITKKIAQRTDRSQSKDNTQEKGNKQDKSKSYKGNDDHKGRHRHESGKEDHHEKDKNRRKSGSQSKENAERRENKTKGGINREKVASTSGGASTVTNKVPSGSQSEDNAKRRKNKTRGGISRENVASNSGGASTVTNKVPSGSQSKENAERRENMTKGGISRENVASSSGGASFVTNKVPSGSQSKENAERRENKTNDGISREIVSSTSGGASSVTKVQSVTSHIITSTTSVTRPTAHVSSAILLQKKPSGSQHPSNIPARTGPMTSVYRQQSNTAGQQTRTPFSLNQGNTPGKVVHGNKENMPPNMVDKNALLLWNDFLKVILKWTPDWFEEKDKMEKSGQKKIPPPPVTNDLRGHNEHQLFALIDRYLSYSDYSDRFMLPLLLHETWESCYNEWREGKSKSRCAPHNMMLSNMEATKNKSMAIYVLHGLVDERDRSRGNYSSEGDLVKLVVQGQMKVAGMKPMEYKMTGYIEKVTFSEFSVEKLCSHNQQIGKSRPRHAISMTMRILIRSRPFMPDTNCLVSVETESAIVNTRRQFNALAHLATNPLCPHLLFPTHNPTYTDTAPASIGLKEKYNESQSRAINSAVKISLLPDNLPRIILLQGPPGTGKSHTIIGIIKKIVQASNGQGRVCLCAPSHSAIDELLRRLVKHNRDNPGCEIRVVRLGKKCSPDIQHLLLDRQVQMNVLQAYKVEERPSEVGAREGCDREQVCH